MRSCDGHGAVSQGYRRANWPNPKASLFTDPRSLPSRMTEVNITLHVLAFSVYADKLMVWNPGQLPGA